MKSVVCIHGFGRHPEGRQPGFSAPLHAAVEERLGGATFHNVECREVAAPPGTHGLEHHRLYWHHEDVIDWLSRVLATSQTEGDAI